MNRLSLVYRCEKQANSRSFAHSTLKNTPLFPDKGNFNFRTRQTTSQ